MPRFLARFLPLLLAGLVLSSAMAAPKAQPLTVRLFQRTPAAITELRLSGRVPAGIAFPRNGSMSVVIRFRRSGSSQPGVVVEKERLDFDACPRTFVEVCVGYPALIDRGRILFPLLVLSPKKGGRFSILASNFTGAPGIQFWGSMHWHP